MVWAFQDWILCNVLIGVGIVLFTYLILFILLCWFHQILYSMIAKLVNIKRCIIDVNNKVVKNNNKILTSHVARKKVGHLHLNLGEYLVKTNNENAKRPTNVVSSEDSNVSSKKLANTKENIEMNTIENRIEDLTSDSKNDERNHRSIDLVQTSDFVGCCWSNKVGMDHTTKLDQSQIPQNLSTTETEDSSNNNHPSSPDHTREVLDVYGKYLTLNKKRNKFLIMTITAILISSVIIAGIQGCLLANVTVYQGGSCPFYGVMECFYGSNSTYFQCTSNATIDLDFGTSATCFRWILRDTSVADVMTQIGSCTGLLAAFGGCIEVLMRFLFFVFQQRPGVSSGIRRMLEKTVGINKITQPTRCCGIELPCHLGVLNLHLYQHPWLVVLVILFYLSLPVVAIASIVLLSHFRISITALTYIVLITVVAICLLGLFWVLWEEDEVGKILPGSWISFSEAGNMIKTAKFNKLIYSVLPKENVDELTSFADHFVEKLKTDVRNMAGELNKEITKMVTDIPKQLGNKLLMEANQALRDGLNMITVFVKEIGNTLSGEAKEFISPIQTIIAELPTKIGNEVSAKAKDLTSPIHKTMTEFPKQIGNKLSIEAKQLIRPTQDIIAKLLMQTGNERLTSEAEQLIRSVQEIIEKIPTQIVSEHSTNEVEHLIQPVREIIENLPTQIENELATEVEALLSSTRSMIADLPKYIGERLINGINELVDPAQELMEKLPSSFGSEHFTEEVKEFVRSGQIMITELPAQIENKLSTEAKQIIRPAQDLITNLPKQIGEKLSVKVEKLILPIKEMIEKVPEQIENKILTEIRQAICSAQEKIAKLPGQIDNERLTREFQQYIHSIEDTIAELSTRIKNKVLIEVQQLIVPAQDKIAKLLIQISSEYLISEVKQFMNPVKDIMEDLSRQIQYRLSIEIKRLLHKSGQSIITEVSTQSMRENLTDDITQLIRPARDAIAQWPIQIDNERLSSKVQRPTRSVKDIAPKSPNSSLTGKAQDIRSCKMAEQAKDVGKHFSHKN